MPWLTYGRLRPLHTNAVVFAFAGNAVLPPALLLVQRLLRTRCSATRLALPLLGLAGLIVAGGDHPAPGHHTSKEYAELEWPIDIAIAIVWISFAINMFGTIGGAASAHLYVAIWFYIATWIGITMLHIVNSFGCR